MGGRLGKLLRSLEIRLLLLSAVTIGAVLIAQAMLSFRSTRAEVADFMRGEIERSSALIRGATHDGMLLNRLGDVQATIERIAVAPEVVAIRVYDKDGSIVLSGAQAERGRRIDLASETCRSCHTDGTARDDAVMERSGLHEVPDEPEVLRHLSVIPNEPACATAGCHAPPQEQPVLGVLDVEMSLKMLNASLGTAHRRIVWTTAVLILVGGCALVAAVWRLVHRPVVLLHEGTRRIAAGDLDTTINVTGRHELASLAAAFNQMTADLRTARHAVLEGSQRLEEKVAEKTEDLRRAQHQVLHMEKMASLGKLSATVAHELNNPLAGMLTYARLIKRELADQPLDEESRRDVAHYLDLVDRECARCGTIVHNLLTFARHNGTDMQPVDVRDIVGRSLAIVRHHLEISGVQVVAEPFEGDGMIVADPGQLQQALVALLVNAVEAMQGTPEADRRLTLSTHGADTWVEMAIADRGMGIEPDVLPQIFEPFFSTKTKDGGSGVGLGLAVVYGIVNRHGGSVDVQSEPGCGTTFRVRVPRRPPAAETGASGDTAEMPSNRRSAPDQSAPVASRAGASRHTANPEAESWPMTSPVS